MIKKRKKYKFTEEHKRRISKALMGHIISEETRKKISNTLKGRKLSDERKRNMSKGKKGKYRGEQHCFYGKKHSPESRKNMSESKKGNKNSLGYKHSEETKRKMSKTRLNMTEQTRKKMSIASKRNWANKEYREKQIKVMLKGLRKRPTAYEQKVIDICKKHNFSFRYVGDGEVIIAGKNPDFIEINGRKLLIETYAKYWHPEDYEEVRYKIFAEYGYKTLFLNENDLLGEGWEKNCTEKISLFIME